MSQEPPTSTPQHWDGRYAASGAAGVSWYQAKPVMSLALIEASGVAPATPIIDAGGGESTLADELLQRGFSDITVLDISPGAIAATRERLGADAALTCAVADLRTWRPSRRYGLWHDRAVLHFMRRGDERDAYIAALDAGVADDGWVVLATFASDGPERCSELPVTRYDAEALAALLPERFGVVSSRREVHVTPWGAEQPFTWLLARSRQVS